MLVIDRVELDVLDQLEKMRKLDGHGAVGLQQQGDAGDKVIELRHMREHIVADDQIGLPALARQGPRQMLAEELDQGRNADLLRRGGDGIGRIDAEHRHAHGDEILQQIAVVAGKFDHQAVGVEREAPARHVAVRLACASQSSE